MKFGRVISGTYRGKKIPLINDESVRPTTDRVKETIFNMLKSRYGDSIFGGPVLDAFAGSGGFGLECISRGAKSVVFVDSNSKCIEKIAFFTKSLETNCKTYFLVSDITCLDFSFLKLQFSLIFLDPPYKSDLVEKSLNNILKYNLISKDSVFIIESPNSFKIEALELHANKKIGNTRIQIYMLK